MPHARQQDTGNFGCGSLNLGSGILPSNQSFTEYLNDGTIDEAFIDSLDPSKFIFLLVAIFSA
jgi:hypothetical protein